ncbi:MAG: hypothetical protein B7Z06_02185 [Flavobacteriales bacterium 32-35-8]|nr:MAG: hypothetical protein B7Z06_02185 [Flavobacteriales bacterium 32-35-8]
MSVFVPFIIFIYNGTKNTVSIKKQSLLLIKNNGITYSEKDVWRKNFMAISNDNKTLTYINFKQDNPFISNISLTDVKQCHIIKNYNSNDANKATSLKNLDLEFVHKSPSKPNVIINFFNIDDDLSEDFELQRIEKWQALIKNAIVEPQQVKVAS